MQRRLPALAVPLVICHILPSDPSHCASVGAKRAPLQSPSRNTGTRAHNTYNLWKCGSNLRKRLRLQRCHVVPVDQDRPLRLLEIADHIGAHRRAIHNLVGGVPRRRIRLLAGRTPARTGALRRGARRRSRPATDITPPPYNARTRVHEYGGGSWIVRNGTVYFSNLADGRLYCQEPGVSEPRALTPEPPAPGRQWRYADGVIDQRRNRWIGVREDHTADGEPVNAIVAVGLDGDSGPGQVLASGHDFYASPRPSPDGRWLFWLAWDHPNMP